MKLSKNLQNSKYYVCITKLDAIYSITLNMHSEMSVVNANEIYVRQFLDILLGDMFILPGNLGK